MPVRLYRTGFAYVGRGTDCIRWTRAKLDALPREKMAPLARGGDLLPPRALWLLRFCLTVCGSGSVGWFRAETAIPPEGRCGSWMDGRSGAVTGRIFRVCVVVVVLSGGRARPTNDRSLFTSRDERRKLGKHGAVLRKFVETVGEGAGRRVSGCPARRPPSSSTF